MDGFNQGYNLNGNNSYNGQNNNQFGYQNNQFGQNMNQNYQGMPQNYQNMQTSNKSKVLSLLFCMFLGALGIHRFYLGKIGTGILWFLTGGCFGFGVIVDFIRLCTGSMTDKHGLPLKQDVTPEGSSRWMKFMIVYYVLIFLLSFGICFLSIFAAGSLVNGIVNEADNSVISDIDSIFNNSDYEDYEPYVEEDNESYVEEDNEPYIEEDYTEVPVKDWSLSFMTPNTVYENPDNWIEVEYDYSQYQEYNTGIYTGKVKFCDDYDYKYSDLEKALEGKDLSDLMEYDNFYKDYYGEEGIIELYDMEISEVKVNTIDPDNNVILLEPLYETENPLYILCELFEGTSVSTYNGVSVGDEVKVTGHITKNATKDNFILYTLAIYDYSD